MMVVCIILLGAHLLVRLLGVLRPRLLLLVGLVRAALQESPRSRSPPALFSADPPYDRGNQSY